MSCACQNMKYGQEYVRIRSLAKAWAKLEDSCAVIYQKDNGTYDFTSISRKNELTEQIIEYITPY